VPLPSTTYLVYYKQRTMPKLRISTISSAWRSGLSPGLGFFVNREHPTLAALSLNSSPVRASVPQAWGEELLAPFLPPEKGLGDEGLGETGA